MRIGAKTGCITPRGKNIIQLLAFGVQPLLTVMYLSTYCPYWQKVGTWLCLTNKHAPDQSLTDNRGKCTVLWWRHLTRASINTTQSQIPHTLPCKVRAPGRGAIGALQLHLQVCDVEGVSSGSGALFFRCTLGLLLVVPLFLTLVSCV